MGKTNRRKRRNEKKKKNNQMKMAAPVDKAEVQEEKAVEVLPKEEKATEAPVLEEKAAETLPKEEEKNQDEPSGARLKKRLMWCVVAVGAICLTAYFSGFLYFQDRFLANTTVNGIDVSLLTAAEVEDSVRDNVEAYEISLKERGGASERIEGDEIGYRYVSNGEILRLQEGQNHIFWFSGYFYPTEYTFETCTQYDEELLEDKVDHLNCFKEEVAKLPMNARLSFDGKKYVIQKEEQGCRVKKTQLLKLLKGLLESGNTALDLEAEGCYAVPAVTSDDEYLNTLVENLNHYVDIEITYQFGKQEEVLDGSTVKDWLAYDINGKVLVKDGAIRDYVAYLADKYDTYGENRRFRTTDGSYVSVRGGAYGWKLDQELEAEELTKLMEQEPHIKRVPLFAQTADSWENDGIGDSYVEVDLTKQHLWMYKNGKLVVDSDFVSGKMTYERYTPPGIFRVAFKKSPAVLRSSRPGDSYENPVTFWMPFNGGIGFHDSSWRSSYGGEIFWNSGSHGCINLPYDAAEKIYKNIDTGYLVVCFYRGDEVKKWES